MHEMALPVLFAASRTGLDAKNFVTRGNRLKVNRFNQVEGFDNVFAIGDVAHMETEAFPNGHPMMAQPAIQQGRLLGKNLIRLIAGKQMEPFTYKDKGNGHNYQWCHH